MDPKCADEVVERLAARQHGRVSMWQVLEEGVPRDHIKRRLRQRRLRSIHAGVYAVGHGGETNESRWMAAVLAGGAGACLVLESAAGLLGMVRRPLIDPVHVNSLTRRRDRGALRFHEFALADQDITTWRGIPATTPLRTVTDLRGRMPRPEWGQFVVDAVARGIISRDALRDLQITRPLTRSKLERIALLLIREAGVPMPRVNHVVTGRERDLVWPRHRLVVEIDGPHHDLPVQQGSDRRRDRELHLAGWRCLRYAADELDELIGDLRRLLLSEPLL